MSAAASPSLSAVTASAPESPVAVIAVHGVSDPRSGATATEIARLLMADPASCYSMAATQTIAVPVEAPRLQSVAQEGAQAGWLRPAFVSSQTALRTAAAGTAAAVPYDIAYTNSFQQELALPEEDRVYETVRIELQRARAGGATRIDIHELYWADLSRLSNAVLRIVEEFYQLLFHLTYLAKLTVAHAVAVRPRDTLSGAMGLLLRLHVASEWLLVRPIALVNLYLLLLLAVGAVALLPPPLPGWAVGLLLAASLVAALAWLQWRVHAAVAVGIGLSIGVAVARHAHAVASWLNEPATVLATLLIASLLVYAWLAAFVIRRSQLADETNLVWPLIIWAGALIAMPSPDDAAPVVVIVRLLRATEWGLVLLFVLWSLQVIVNMLIYLTGAWVKTRGCREADARTIDTARLGTFLACTLFVVMTLLAFGIVEALLVRPNLPAAVYPPLFRDMIFAGLQADVLTLAAASQRMMAHAAVSFGALAAMLGVVILVSIYALLPSLARELWPRNGWLSSRGVGRWLDVGAGLLGASLALMFFLLAIGGPVFELTCHRADIALIYCRDWRGDFSLAVGLVGGSAATVIALGDRLGAFMPAVRGVLDVILDVDNYFRDRNPQKTSRGRICARYLALLTHIAQARNPDGSLRYGRLVIIAHSQGTVITADLLRALSYQGSLGTLFGERPIHFVTAGSPLRQLYAARFPDLYRWVDAPLPGMTTGGTLSGPDPRALGLHSWTNLYQSGDYVGRYLWDETGRTQRYEVPPNSASAEILIGHQPTAEIRELCVGSGAHTHYFDGSAPLVRVEIERRLVA